jgi:exosortase B
MNAARLKFFILVSSFMSTATHPPATMQSRFFARLASPWCLIFFALTLHYAPTMWDLMHGLWATQEQAHGPLILLLSLWLIWRRRAEINATLYQPEPKLAWGAIGLSMALHVVGRSQGVLILEIGAMIPMVAGLLLLHSSASVKIAALGLFFMCFMVPLPSALIDALTQPMKMAVSYVTENLLFYLGYPISRTGVMLQIGRYQLLVADACAGLHTLFTLEALGLVYLNVVRHASVVRNVVLAILIVPISFTANVIRVTALTLITYYFGDGAGQGFLHGFAGMVLFVAALLLIIFTDSILRFGVRKRLAQ